MGKVAQVVSTRHEDAVGVVAVDRLVLVEAGRHARQSQKRSRGRTARQPELQAHVQQRRQTVFVPRAVALPAIRRSWRVFVRVSCRARRRARLRSGQDPEARSNPPMPDLETVCFNHQAIARSR